ncbi:hypothetical protein [Methylovulum psychrotolerans]|uniref:Uncharacterized protein n=1 Tax=Methylovulum psychrotolerans TaxID=1704499 RepID=A0A2S5CQ84_9GAMM|nr:hypothetical protein [Methylovulum psychrotolerans]POZ52979.1 hypothetical protein AADEFJLK_01595 [Methylovulum psychrotolerans]
MTNYSIFDQQSKNISFILHNVADGSNPKEMILKVRPEEFNQQDTSRLAVTQTFGGMFIDSFGVGLPTIKLAGHTGWRGKDDATTGFQFMQDLKKLVYTDWHEQRALMAAQGKDPALVHLIYNDFLNDVAWVCAPNSFIAKKTTNAPLLYYYEINITFVDKYLRKKLIKPGLTGLLGDIIASIKRAVTIVAGFMKLVKNTISSWVNFVKDIVGGIMAVSYAITQGVADILSGANGVVNSITGGLSDIAGGLAFATSSLLTSAMAINNFPQEVQAEIQGCVSAFNNLGCIFRNGLKQAQLLNNYDSLFGASLCSSTTGGAPISSYYGLNTFENVLPKDQLSGVEMTTAAMDWMRLVNNSDPILYPLKPSVIENASRGIWEGTSFADYFVLENKSGYPVQVKKKAAL